MSVKKAPAKKVSAKKKAARKKPVKKTAAKNVSAKDKPIVRKGRGKKKAAAKKRPLKKTGVKKGQTKKANLKKPADNQKRQPEWLTLVHMARGHGITPQAFYKWGVEPVAKIGRNVFYLPGDVTANRLENQASRLKKAETSDSVKLLHTEREEKLRLTKAQAEGQEIKNAQLRKELAPVLVIEWVIGKAGAQICAILDALPLQLKKRSRNLTAANIETIRRELVKAQNAAAVITVDLDEYYDQNESADK